MKKIITTLVLACAANVTFAVSFLVSLDEMNASNNAPSKFTAKSIPVKDAPVIELSAPTLSEPINSPTSIDLKFRTTAPSTAKPDSFRVLYGAFEIDITKRLLNMAKISEQGVFVGEASLPKGKHKLVLVIEDSAGRKGNSTINFEVR